MLAAAYITFLSGFSKAYRQRLLTQWVDQLLLDGVHVSFNDRFSLVELFGDNVKVRTWTSNHGLPNDEHTISNAIVMEKT